MMKKREWVEIAVYFDDNWVQHIKRKDIGQLNFEHLAPRLTDDIRRFYKDLRTLLGEAED